jgi:hypothetical protein
MAPDNFALLPLLHDYVIALSLNYSMRFVALLIFNEVSSLQLSLA